MGHYGSWLSALTGIRIKGVEFRDNIRAFPRVKENPPLYHLTTNLSGVSKAGFECVIVRAIFLISRHQCFLYEASEKMCISFLTIKQGLHSVEQVTDG